MSAAHACAQNLDNRFARILYLQLTQRHYGFHPNGILPDCIHRSQPGGAIEIEQYKAGLLEAGFAEVAIIDSKADLNAYANVDNQAICCSPVVSSSTLPMATQDSCCGSDAVATSVHEGLRELLRQHDVNAYAASVKVFAVKPLQ